jgi:hypothetical protein
MQEVVVQQQQLEIPQEVVVQPVVQQQAQIWQQPESQEVVVQEQNETQQQNDQLQDRISVVQRLAQFQTQIWENVYDMNRRDPLIDVLPTIAPIWGHVDERTRQKIFTGVVRALIHDITPHLVASIVGAINENYNDSNPAQQHLDNQDRDAFLPQAIQLTIEAMAPTIAAATAVKVMRPVDNVVQPLTYSSASTGQYLSPAPSPQPPSPPPPPASSRRASSPPSRPNPFVITESLQSPRSWLPNSPDWNYTILTTIVMTVMRMCL